MLLKYKAGAATICLHCLLSFQRCCVDRRFFKERPANIGSWQMPQVKSNPLLSHFLLKLRQIETRAHNQIQSEGLSQGGVDPGEDYIAAAKRGGALAR